VPKNHERLALPQLIGEPAARQLQQTRCCFGYTLDEAEKGRARSQYARQEERQQRIDHLAGHIGEQRDYTQPENVAAKDPAVFADWLTTGGLTLGCRQAFTAVRTVDSVRSTSSSVL